MTFSQETTTGYTDAELAALNAEWAEIVEAESLEPDTGEYIDREKQFADEVSRRIEDQPEYPELSKAIARSISHNEIASVEVTTPDGTLDDVLAAIWKIHGDKYGYNTENDGSYDIYGWSGDDAEGAMDWRIRVTLATVGAED